jgi:hypothetical protein
VYNSLTLISLSLSFFTTDASKSAVAAVLSQVKDGVERPLALASRQQNKAEQSYAATEAEMLALIWTTKYIIVVTFWDAN